MLDRDFGWQWCSGAELKPMTTKHRLAEYRDYRSCSRSAGTTMVVVSEGGKRSVLGFSRRLLAGSCSWCDHYCYCCCWCYNGNFHGQGHAVGQPALRDSQLASPHCRAHYRTDIIANEPSGRLRSTVRAARPAWAAIGNDLLFASKEGSFDSANCLLLIGYTKWHCCGSKELNILYVHRRISRKVLAVCKHTRFDAIIKGSIPRTDRMNMPI